MLCRPQKSFEVFECLSSLHLHCYRRKREIPTRNTEVETAAEGKFPPEAQQWKEMMKSYQPTFSCVLWLHPADTRCQKDPFMTSSRRPWDVLCPLGSAGWLAAQKWKEMMKSYQLSLLFYGCTQRTPDVKKDPFMTSTRRF